MNLIQIKNGYMLFLDDTDITHIFKDKGKLSRIVKKLLPVTFFFFQYLFVNFIFGCF